MSLHRQMVKRNKEECTHITLLNLLGSFYEIGISTL